MRWILFIFPLWLTAQQAAVYDADFRFADGVFLSAASLLENTPDVPWSGISGEMVQLPEDHRVQIDGYGYHQASLSGEPYAISLDGTVYLFVRRDARLGFYEFAGLRGPGPYPTVRYDTVEHRRQLMRAYNPATGMAFREGYIERDRRSTVVRIVDMRTGSRLPLRPGVVAQLVADEPDIAAAVAKLTPEDETKMMRALLLYSQRHPLRIPVNQDPDR